MKKFIKLFIFVLTFGLFILPNVKAETINVTVIHDGTEKNYEKINAALNDLQDGDTIKFLTEVKDSIYGTNELNKKVIIDKNVTVDFNNQKVHLPFVVKNGSQVKFIGGVSSSGGTPNSPITIEDNAKVVVDGGKYLVSYAPPLFKVLSNVTLEIMNITVNGNFCELAGNNSILKVNNSKIESGRKGFIINGNKNTVNVTGGTFKGMYGVTEFAESADGNIFNFDKVESLTTELEMKGSNNTVNIKDTLHRGAISDYAVKVLGTNNTYKVSGNSVVKGGYGAIFTDSETAKVIIDGGSIETYNEDTKWNRLTPVIVSKNSGNITINGGTITGQVGIAVFNGNVNINGGTITSTNTDKEKYNVFYDSKYFDSSYDNLIPLGNFGKDINFYGASVITDNNAKVTITGGNFNSATEETLVSVNNNKNNYSVSGGIYNHPFNQEFIIPDKLELKITNKENSLWYVGNDALTAVESAKKDDANVIEVLQGNLNIMNAKVGLLVKNSGNGKVTVNEKNVEKGLTVAAEAMPEKPQTNSNTNNEKDSNKEKNPKTKDDIYTWISIISTGIVGLSYTIKKKIFN